MIRTGYCYIPIDKSRIHTHMDKSYKTTHQQQHLSDDKETKNTITKYFDKLSIRPNYLEIGSGNRLNEINKIKPITVIIIPPTKTDHDAHSEEDHIMTSKIVYSLTKDTAKSLCSCNKQNFDSSKKRRIKEIKRGLNVRSSSNSKNIEPQDLELDTFVSLFH